MAHIPDRALNGEGPQGAMDDSVAKALLSEFEREKNEKELDALGLFNLNELTPNMIGSSPTNESIDHKYID